MIHDSLERLYSVINKHSEVFLNFQLADESLSIFKTTLKAVKNVSTPYKRALSNELIKFLEDRVYDAELLIQFKKGNSGFLEDLLKKEMTNNAP